VLSERTDGGSSVLLFARREVITQPDAMQLAVKTRQRASSLDDVSVVHGGRIGDHGSILRSDRVGHRRGDGAFLGGRTGSTEPDRRRPAGLLDFVCDPFQLLACAGIGWQCHEAVEQLNVAVMA
jgi:hypothetical protein